jgi:hypothetical protein
MNPPKPCSGISPQAQWNNQLRAFCISIKLLRHAGYNLLESPNGCAFDLPNQPGGKSAPISVSLYYFKSDQKDYVVANPKAATSLTDSTGDVYIAKPDDIVQTITQETLPTGIYKYTYSQGPDGNNPYRTGTNTTDATDVEIQLQVPPWLVDRRIMAVSCQPIAAFDGKSLTLFMLRAPYWAKQ